MSEMKEIQDKVNQLHTTVELMRQDVAYIKEKSQDDGKKYVTVSRFRPVEAIVLAMAGGILIWSLNQLLHLVETAKALL